MKILFVTSSSINGGAQKHIREMFKSLSALGHEMYLSAPEGWLLDELSDYKSKLYPFASKREGVSVVSKLIKEIKPDITNTFILSGAVIGTLAWKKNQYGKLFVTVNNPVLYDGVSLAGRLLYPRLYRYISKYASAFLVKSDTVRDEVEKVICGKKPVLSIKNGVDFSIFNKDALYNNFKKELGVGEKEIVIGNVAVLNERKGQQYLIEAVAKLRDRYPLHLIIAGEGPFRQELEQRVSQLNASNYVHFLGRRSDVNTVLANCDVFVLPSLHEGLPNSLMEAMAMGLPCVATDVGGVRQLIADGENGIVIEPKSSEAIALSIEKLLGDVKMMETYGREAYNFIYAGFKQEAVAKELVEIYQTI